jgi:HD superfamily phosphodiesterase
MRGYLDDNDIENIKHYTKFLDALPSDKYEEIARELIYLVCEYKNNHSFMFQEFTKPRKDLADKTPPSRKMPKDIKSLKDAKETLLNLFPSYHKDKRAWLNPPSGLKETLLFLDKSIHDLEQKEFKIINQKRYYEEKAPAKTNIINYVKSLIKTYSIQSASIHAKEFYKAL